MMRGWMSRNSALITLVLIIIYGTISSPYFLTEMNISAILYQYSIIGFLAFGQLLVILTGGIDLSQGALLALISIVTAVLMGSFGLAVAIPGALLVGVGMGLISGLLVSRTQMPPFVVTLGMLGVARGLAMLIANSKPVPVTNPLFAKFGQISLAGIPLSALLWVVAGFVLYWFLTRRRLGRHMYAVGSSEENSRLSGINVKNVKMYAYVLSGLLTAVGGIIWTARLGAGSPIAGSNYELESIAAVVIGGGSLFGGEGSVAGTMAGALIFGIINSVLNLTGISPFWQGTIKGVLVLIAVAFSQVRRGQTKN